MSVSTSIPYDIIPSFPQPSVRGHDGELLAGNICGVESVFMRGRVHYYEGLSMAEVVFPVMLLYELGVRTIILMSAVGGISEDLKPGSLMVVRDHINLMGDSPLRTGQADSNREDLFLDMVDAYDPGLSELAAESAKGAGLGCKRGVLAGVCGPAYETPAEVRMLKAMGADAVCMSMVPEVIAARYLGMRVLGLAVVTNMAAGLSESGPNHDEVLKVSGGASPGISSMLETLVGKAASDGVV